MALANTYYPHAILFGASPTITQLTDVDASNNVQDFMEFSASEFGPQFVGLMAANPNINFTTRDLKTVFDDLDDEDLAVNLSAGNVDLWYKQGKPLGTRTADITAAHIRARLTTNAMAYWRSFRVRQGQAAELACSLVTQWDGTNDPLIFTGSTALSGTSAVNQVYSLGLVDINGTDLTGVTSVDWDNNVRLETISSDGEAFPGFVGIETMSPEITIETMDTTQLATFDLRGTALTGLTVYLRKMQRDNIFVIDATAEHIKISATDGIVYGEGVRGSPGEARLTVKLQKPAGQLFTIDTASAIT